jgi:hypothetical protein
MHTVISLLTANELLAAQRGLNKYFVKNRDSGGIIDGTYSRLKEIEAELSKRKIKW